MRCSLLSFSRFKALDSSDSRICSSCFIWRFHTNQHYVFFFWTSSACISPLLNLVPLPPANAALPPHPCLQTSYPPSAHFVSPLSAPFPSLYAPGYFSIFPASSSLIRSGFFNGMPEVSEPGALNTTFNFVSSCRSYLYPGIQP